MITAFAQGSRYTPARLRYKLALWVTRCHRPFSIVEDPELVDIFQDFNSRVLIPSRHTLTRDIQDIYQVTRKSLALKLQQAEGKVHLIIDGWTSPQFYSFIGVVVQFLYENELKLTTLDYIK